MRKPRDLSINAKGFEVARCEVVSGIDKVKGKPINRLMVKVSFGFDDSLLPDEAIKVAKWLEKSAKWIKAQEKNSP